MSTQNSNQKNHNSISKKSHKNIMQKNLSHWSKHYQNSYPNSNSTYNVYPHSWKDSEEKTEKIDLGFDGWEFNLTTNSWTCKIDGIRNFADSGVNILISAKINSGSMNSFFHVLLSNNTASPSEDVQQDFDDNSIEVRLTIKSADEDYKKWFKNWNINQEGMSLTFSSKDNGPIIESLSSINQIIEKIKGRLILEKLSQRK